MSIYKGSTLIADSGNGVVHTTGAETITGTKTFTNAIQQKNTDVTKGTTPSSAKYWGLDFNDSTSDASGTTWQGTRLGVLEAALTADNKTSIYIAALKNEANATSNAMLKATYDTANDKAYTYAVTPDASSNSTEIATTAWCNLTGNDLVHKSGAETITGVKTFTQTIQGTALNALWADLAENYRSDEVYPIGTLIKFGGEYDITVADIECNGVISEKPGYLLDSQLEHSQPVALVGKTPLRIIGKVNRFDKIALSEIPGIGRVAKEGEVVIGKALEASEVEEEKLVLCVTKFNLC